MNKPPEKAVAPEDPLDVIRRDIEKLKTNGLVRKHEIWATEFPPLIAFIGVVTWMSIQWLRAPDVIDVCYVETSGESYRLKGNVEWHEDHELGSYKTIDEAVATAAKLSCPMRKGQQQP